MPNVHSASTESEVITKSPAVCSECGSSDWLSHHHQGSFAVPECVYKECEDCGFQWDHQ